MIVSEVMTRDPIVITPYETTRTAARLMRDRDIGVLPVVNHHKLVGVVTDRDIAIRGDAVGLDPWSATIEQVMTPEVRWCRCDQQLEEAMGIMSAERIRRLPVVDAKDRLVGIVTLGDLSKGVISPEAMCATVQAVSTPTLDAPPHTP